MKPLQDIFDEQLKSYCDPVKIGTEIVAKRLRKFGIEPNKSQLSAIRSLFSEKTNGILNIQFEDNQIKSAGFESEEELAVELQDLLDGLGEELSSVSGELLNNLPDIVTGMTDEISIKLLKSLKNRSKKMLKEQSGIRKDFSSNLYKSYKKALDLLETQIVIAFEAGDLFNREGRPKAAESNDYVFEVLSRFHARACQVATEIITLLKAGLADGAHARWRTLHELAVVAMFIQEYGNDVAERYLLHNGIESYKASKTYQENCKALGYEPINAQEMDEIKQNYLNLIKRFGKEYGSDYGWSAKVMGQSRPNFYEIEKKAGLDHLRPFYKMACNNVHAGATGLFFKLGLCEESGEILLAGPSNLGLTDPGQSAGISLTQITTTFILHSPNIDRIVTSKILINLDNEIGEAFWEAEQLISDNN